MEDQDFKDTFSRLAFSTLQNSFPEILPYVQSFEHSESNENKTRALGVFKLKVGQEEAHIPVMFGSGRVRPYSLLYIKSEDRFIPLTKRAISDLMQNQGTELGVSQNMRPQNLSHPNLDPYINPPRTGRVVTASYDSPTQAWARFPESKTSSLPSIISKQNNLVKTAYLKYLSNNAEYTKASARAYGWETIKEACILKTASPNRPLIEPVALYETEDDFKVLDKRAAVDLRDTAVIDNVTRFDEVAETGIYLVPNKVGDLKVCIYLEARSYEKIKVNIQLDHRYDLCTKSSFKGTLIPVGTKKPISVSSKDRILGIKVDLGPENIHEMLSDLPTLESVKPNNTYVAFLKKGEDKLKMSETFQVLTKTKDASGLSTLYVRMGTSWEAKELTIVCTNVPNQLTAPKEGVLAMSKDVKVLKVGSEVNSFSGDARLDPKTEQVSEPDLMFNQMDPIRLMRLMMRNKGYVENALRQIRDIGFSLSSEGETLPPMSKKAMAEKLCLEMRIPGDKAESILKTAEANGTCLFFVEPMSKEANYPYSINPAGPQLGQLPIAQLTQPQYYQEGQYPAVYHTTAAYPYQNLQQPQVAYPRPIYDPMQHQMQMQTALQTEDQGVADSTAILQLSRTSDIGDVIQSYLPDLRVSVDKLGRILFLLWYKSDQFSKSYASFGGQEVEEKVKNLFKELGSLLQTFESSKREKDTAFALGKAQ